MCDGNAFLALYLSVPDDNSAVNTARYIESVSSIKYVHIEN